MLELEANKVDSRAWRIRKPSTIRMSQTVSTTTQRPKQEIKRESDAAVIDRSLVELFIVCKEAVVSLRFLSLPFLKYIPQKSLTVCKKSHLTLIGQIVMSHLSCQNFQGRCGKKVTLCQVSSLVKTLPNIFLAK